MQQLTENGQRLVNDVAQRHGFSTDAVIQMLMAVSAGYGNQAQFNHPEFGGMGQWSSGGMVMIGDMFNNYLKGRVSSLCQELSGLIQGQPLFAAPAQSQSQSQGGGWQGQSGGGGQQQSSGGYSGSSLFVGGGQSSNWWPSDLGSAGSTGAQNNLRYAYFPMARRLAIDVSGVVTVYDTGDNQIGGFSQQQSGDQSLTFTSQFGLVRVADLPIVSGQGAQAQRTATPSFTPDPAPVVQQPVQQPWTPSVVQNNQPIPALVPAPVPPAVNLSPGNSNSATPKLNSDEIFSLIEKLADLHAKGILSTAEYEGKKAELLGRL